LMKCLWESVLSVLENSSKKLVITSHALFSLMKLILF
jgi:hypothetical protein